MARPSEPMLGFSLGALTGINILLTFAYQWLVFTLVGPGSGTDALFAASIVPQLTLVIMSGSLNYVLVPLLAVEPSEAQAQLAWTFLQGIGAVSLAVVGLLMLSAPVWVPLTVPGFPAATARLAVHLTRLQLLGAVFTTIAGAALAFHHVKHDFMRVEGAGVLAALASLGFVLWGLPRWGVEAAAWGMVLRSGVLMLLLTSGMGRYRTPRWSHPGLRVGIRRATPLVVGQLYYKCDGLLDRFLASLAPTGTLSLYHISQQLWASSSLVLNRALVAPVVPKLSRLASGREWPAFLAQVRRRLLLLLVVTLAGCAALAVVGRPLLGFLLGYGAVSPDRVGQLWWLLLLLSGVWIGGAAGQILSTAFYAQGDTVTPSRVGVAGFTVAIAVKVVAFLGYGIEGLALAASLYYLGNATVLFVCLRRRSRRVMGRPSHLEEFASP